MSAQTLFHMFSFLQKVRFEDVFEDLNPYSLSSALIALLGNAAKMIQA